MANPKIKKPMTFGCIRPSNPTGFPLPMGASEVIKTRSGRFVKNDGSGRGEIAGDGHTTLMGWVESGDETCSSTEGGTVLRCIDDVTATFRLPLRYAAATYTVNYSSAVIGGKYDLVVISDVQYVNLTTQTEGTVIVVGGQAASSTTANDGFVEVKLNPETLWTA
jgi:hypothetical protein